MLSMDGIERLVEPVLTGLGLVLHDISLKREGRDLVLRIVADRDKTKAADAEDDAPCGVTVDELAHASDEVGAVLDLENPIDDRYRLVLESPGIERDLTSWRHFCYAVGEEVRIVTRGEDSAVIEGVLDATDDETRTVTVITDDGPVTVDTAQIKAARTVFHWQGGERRKF